MVLRLKNRKHKFKVRRIKHKVLLDFNKSIHCHSILCDNSTILDILTEDNLEEYKKQEDSITRHIFLTRCNSKVSYCNDMTLQSCILNYNDGDIAKYIIKKLGVKLIDFITFIIANIYNDDNKNQKSMFPMLTYMFMFKKMERKNVELLIDYMVKVNNNNDNYNLLDFVDYLHVLGYRASDKNAFIRNVGIEKMWKYKKYGYVLSISKFETIDDLLVKSKILKINIDETMFSDKKKRIYFNNIFANGTVKDLKYIIDKGFVPNQNCFNIACRNNNVDIIEYLLNNKSFKLMEIDICNFFGIAKLPKYFNIKGTYDIHYINQKIKNFNQKISDTDKYEASMIRIIKDNKILKKLYKKEIVLIFNLILSCRLFKLFDHLYNNINLQIILDKTQLVHVIFNYIKLDDVVSLKKLHEFNLITAADISENGDYYKYAIRHGSNKIIKYFDKELGMVLNMKSTSSLSSLVRMCSSPDKELVDNLINGGISVERVFNIYCEKKNKTDILKYICENHNIDNLKEDIKYIDTVVAKGNYVLSDYLIEKGFQYTKHMMVNRIINQIASSCKMWRIQYGKKIHKRMVKYICNKLNGTVTSSCIDKLLLTQNFDVIIYICDNYKIKLKAQMIVDYFVILARPYGFRLKLTNVIKLYEFLKYCEANMTINPLTVVPKKNIEIFSYNLLRANTKNDKSWFEFVDYLVKHSNINFTNDKLNTTSINNMLVNNGSNEMLTFFEKHGVTIDKDMIIVTLGCCKVEHIEDVAKRMVLTTKDINTCLYRYGGSKLLFELEKHVKINITPYTIEMVLHSMLQKIKNYAYFPNNAEEIIKILMKYQVISVNTKNQLLEKNITEGAIKLIEKMDAVEYEPTEEELILKN